MPRKLLGAVNDSAGSYVENDNSFSIDIILYYDDYLSKVGSTDFIHPK